MARVVFMGTPEFAVPSLQALINRHEVVGVVTQPDRPAGRRRQLRPSPVKVAALAAGRPLYQPRSLRRFEAAEPLRDWAPDAIVVTAFGQILRPHVLELPPAGCINVHASLLPRWRGASPIQHAILAGDAVTGVSLMRMDPGLDTGPVFTTRAVPISATTTASDLHDELATLGARLLADHLDAIVAGRLPATPQDESQATYAPLIRKEDGRLDWREDNNALDRRVRAMTPWPGAFTFWDGEPLKILDARPVAVDRPAPPGRVEVVDETAVVHSGSGGLQLLRVQLAGKRAVDSAAFLRGRPAFAGATLDMGATTDGDKAKEVDAV